MLFFPKEKQRFEMDQSERTHMQIKLYNITFSEMFENEQFC